VHDAVLLPVYNEGATVGGVLDAVRRYFDGCIIVVDDGSRDSTPEVLAARDDLEIITLSRNRGYGFALTTGFGHARRIGVDRLITMDCDGQHEPGHIPQFLHALTEGRADIVSGSRYLPGSGSAGAVPPERRRVNETVSERINAVTGWEITDAFCGFKAYGMSPLARLDLHEPGYGMPIELWAKAWLAGLTVTEIPVERIYCDHDRSFGADLDDPELRLRYYAEVWDRALEEDEQL